MSAFIVDSGYLAFFSNEPGSHATMFGPRGRLPFKEDASRFCDMDRAYTWAFSNPDHVVDGEVYVFATTERTVVGEVVAGGQIRVVDRQIDVVRDVTGKPVRIANEAEPLVEISTAYQGPSASMMSSPRGPKVSVVTCSYNRPDLLRAACESLRRQTDPDWEHLIYDDASTDPAIANVLDWAEEDPRVRVWRGKVNVDKPAMRWNFLMDRALGRYLTVLDDDNEKLPRFIEIMAGELDNDPTVEVVTCGWVVQDDREHNQAMDYHLNVNTNAGELDRMSTCDGGAMLYRREAFEKTGYFSEAIRTNEDWDWLRRAIHAAHFKNLQAVCATYREHRANRMLRADALGSDADASKVKSRVLQPVVGVRTVRPPLLRLTRSQEDVVRGLEHAIAGLPWIKHGNDLAVVMSPFQLSDAEVVQAVKGIAQTLSVHMEDPYALSVNVERVRSMARHSEVWVCTNDAGCVSHYREVVGDRVIVCPTLGVDTEVFARIRPADRGAIDVLLCGYAYPSRKKFVRDLLPLLPGKKIVLVGDGWEDFLAGSRPLVKTMPTQDAEATYGLHAQARAVVCLHRTSGDCSDGPVPPRTVNRGFMEGALGARVFLDRLRSDHPFEPGEVIWYDAPGDLAALLRDYLDQPVSDVADRFADKCRMLYSYRARLARVLNCVRAPRPMAVIP